MNFHSLLVGTVAVLLPAASELRAQQEKREDRELAVLDARLQEQRATAVRSRLILYTDELQLLEAQFASAGDSASVNSVRGELEVARLAIKQLAAIARGNAEFPAADELKDGEPRNAAALATKGIDNIISRFDRAKIDNTAVAVRNPSASQPRQRILKIEKASLNRSYSELDAGSYWANESSFAAWTVDDMAPGEYEIILRYSAGDNTGGTVVIKAAGQKLEVTVPKSEKGQNQRERRLNAGVVRIKEPGVDIRIEHGGLASGAVSLWSLEAVILQPAGKRP